MQKSMRLKYEPSSEPLHIAPSLSRSLSRSLADPPLFSLSLTHTHTHTVSLFEATRRDHLATLMPLQGYLAHKKPLPPRNLQ